jgi:TRAP transporter TAXI family solute receptor
MGACKSRAFSAVIIAFFFAGLIVGVPLAEAQQKCKETTYVTISDGTATAGTMMVAAKWAELINKNVPCVSASATTGSFVSNALTVNQKRHTIGQADPNILYTATRGLDERFKGKETKNLRFINAFHHGAIHIFVPKNSPIKAVRDITTYPCRNIMVVSKLSAVYMQVSKIFEAYGSSIDDLQKRGGSLAFVDYQGGVELMKDGQADIMMFHTTIPNSSIMDVDTNPGVRFLEMEPEIIEKLTHLLPGYVPVTIPGGSYRNMPNDYHSIGVYFHHFTHKDVPEDLIYQVTKVFWEHEKEFQDLGSWGKVIKLETALRAVNIPVHPGAARYYREKGLQVPDVKMP